MSSIRFAPSCALRFATLAIWPLILLAACTLSGIPSVETPKGPGVPIGSAAPSATTTVSVRQSPSRSGLSGRLIFLAPGPGGGTGVVTAIDMRGGTTTPLWSPFERDDLGARHPSIAPDGTRLAYARDASGDASGLIMVRHLAPDAPAPLAMKSPDWVDGILWAADARGIYYGQTFGEWSHEARASITGWELHHLALDDSSLKRFGPPPTVGPLTWGINMGEDRIVARLEGDALGEDRFPQLAGFDPASRHAAVLIGPGENGAIDTLLVLDTAGGGTVARIATFDEAFVASPSPDGRWLAYGECLGCDEDQPYRVKVLDLASGETHELTAMPRTAAGVGSPATVTRIVWSRDSQWVAWDTNGRLWGAARLAQGADGDPWQSVAIPRDVGTSIAFAPDRPLLLTGAGRLVDLSTGIVVPLPWRPSAEAPWRDLEHSTWLGWVPDPGTAPADARVAVGTGTPASSSAAPRAGNTAPQPAPVVATPVTPTEWRKPVLDAATWSPDGRWLPLWVGDRFVYDYPEAPAALYFLDTDSSVLCEQLGAARVTHSDDVFWQADGTVIVRTGGKAARGRPCRALAPQPESTYALPTAPPGETPSWAEAPPSEGGDYSVGERDLGASPSGRYRAVRDYQGVSENGVEQHVTRLLTAEGGELVRVAWTADQALGGVAVGGKWLPDDRLLIPATIERGPLLLDPAGTVAEVTTALFKRPVPAPGAGIAAIAGVHVSPNGKDYHLLLFYGGAAAELNSAMVYHPETGAAESLPSKSFWWPPISKDGRWLMIKGHYGEVGADDALWIRPIEGAGGAFRHVPGSGGDVAPSPDGAYHAYAHFDAGTVDLVAFPDGRPVARWRLEDYKAAQVWWSPDGGMLAAEGLRYGGEGGGEVTERAMFLLRVPESP